jgi:2-polyprenyl-3-methyl-5-hydroxy-6-metoxy-1,4-benzoquinol methylase
VAEIPVFAPQLTESTDGYDPKFFDLTASVEQTHFWFVPRRRLLSRLLVRYFPHSEHYLEIGCGTGDMLSTIARSKPWKSVYGSDLHVSGLKRVAARLADRAVLVQLDAKTIPARGRFDVIGAFDVIEHIEDDEQVLRSMHAALAPGGGVALSVPQHPFLWSHSDNIGRHVRRYRRGELEQKLESVGFKVVYSNSYVVLLLPLLIASRLLHKDRNGEDHDASEYVVPRKFNALLRTILQAEVTLALAGLRFPIGGSRVVIARK